MIIAVKIGSKLLTDGNGKIHQEFIMRVCSQLVALKQEGNKIFLVTSGAIASDQNTKRSLGLRAAIGQPKLMDLYRYFIEKIFGLYAAQFLPTYHDLKNENTAFVKIFAEALRSAEVIPFLNYNDPMDDAELKALHKFSDNDRLLQTLCLLVKAEIAVIGFDMPGVIGHRGEKVHIINSLNRDLVSKYIKGGNSLGHSKEGMKTKFNVLCFLADQSIYSILAPGNEENFILRAVAKEENFGTIFMP